MTNINFGKNVDEIFEALGSRGRFQITQFLIIGLSSISAAFQLLNIVFLGQGSSYTCRSIANTTIEEVCPGLVNSSDVTYGTCAVDITGNTSTGGTCSESITCNSWDYSLRKDKSIVTEWDLVCDRTAVSRLPQTMFIAGQGVAAVLLTNLADHLGRRPVIVGAHLLVLILGVALAVAPNITAFLVFRFFQGIAQQGAVLMIVVAQLELFPERLRVSAGVGYNLTWGIPTVIMAGIAYLLRDVSWRVLQGALCVGSVGVLLQLWKLEESMRWLLAKGKRERAEKIARRAAAVNGVDADKIIALVDKACLSAQKQKKNPDATPEDEDQRKAETSNCLHIVQSKRLVANLAICAFTMMVASLTYFSLYLTSDILADDLYLQYFLGSITEITAGPLFGFIAPRYGRRKFFVGFHLITGLTLLGATVAKEVSASQAAYIISTTLAFVGKLGNTAIFNNLFVYLPEIYATNVRHIGFGTCTIAARVGGMMSPFASMLAALVSWLPGAIFGSLCLIVAVLVLQLPETKGRELPQTMREMEEWYLGKKPKEVEKAREPEKFDTYL